MLADTVRAEQQTAPERLFVRVVDRGAEALVLSMPGGWDPARLETASLRLADGTLVQVGKSTDARDDILARFRAVLGLVTLSIVLVALTGGWLVTRSAVLPIRRLMHAVQRIVRTGRTDARVPLSRAPDSGDAIDELTLTFNAMLDKIEGLVTAMRGSLDNVSHDLRTPLTHLRGAAEMALSGPPDLDRYREALADCVEESDRVLVMLNTLMDISEAESGTMVLQREAVRLDEIVRRAAELYRDVAEANGVSLTVNVLPTAQTSEDGTVVLADRTRLEQVAANLIDHVDIEIFADTRKRRLLWRNGERLDRDEPAVPGQRRTNDVVEAPQRHHAFLPRRRDQLQAAGPIHRLSGDHEIVPAQVPADRRHERHLWKHEVRRIAELYQSRCRVVEAGQPIVESRLELPRGQRLSRGWKRQRGGRQQRDGTKAESEGAPMRYVHVSLDQELEPICPNRPEHGKLE